MGLLERDFGQKKEFYEDYQNLASKPPRGARAPAGFPLLEPQ